MKSFKYIFFILFSVLCLNVSAQNDNNITFPVTGNFSFDPQVGQVKNFNKVVIENNVFHLKMDDQIVRSYKAVSEIKGGFSVEQFYLETQSPSQDIEKFNVQITNITENECFFTISYPQGSEKIHLIREN
jgi:hypothetical protein